MIRRVACEDALEIHKRKRANKRMNGAGLEPEHCSISMED